MLGAESRGGLSLERLLWQPTPAPWQIAVGGGWFLVVTAGLWLGTWPLAVVLAPAAGLAAGQTARSWWARGERADVALALLMATLAPLTAAWHTAIFGALLVGGSLVSLLSAAAQRGPSTSPLRDAGFTIQAWMPVGLAAASMVLVHRYEPGAAVWLLCITAMYDAGDYLIGAGASNPFQGPLAGMVAIAVVCFTLVIIGVPPFDTDSAARFGVLAVAATPLGVLLAGVILPDPDATAGGLRRLDSLLVIAPLWAWTVGRYLVSLR